MQRGLGRRQTTEEGQLARLQIDAQHVTVSLYE